jgi:hypothetical protein
MQFKPTGRRAAIRTASAFLLAARLPAAPPFWNRKAPQDWTSDEITQLLNRSPWARETNLDFEAVEGGHLELPPTTGTPSQPGEHAIRPQAEAGSLRRTPVIVRWESAQAIRDALQLPPLQAFAGHYAISISNIPPAAMVRHHAGAHDIMPGPDELLAELQGAASLEAPGREPAGAGIVRKVAGSQNNYLFGFSRDLLPLTGAEKEIDFLLHTARVTVKAKFEPRNMVYRGKFTL